MTNYRTNEIASNGSQPNLIAKELCSIVLMWTDQFEQARSKISERITALAKARAAIEKGSDALLLQKYSDLQKEFSDLLARLYLTLESINKALDQVAKFYLSINQGYLRVISDGLPEKEAQLVKLFVSPKYRKMYDYDREIEKLNHHFDSLVHSYLDNS